MGISINGPSGIDTSYIIDSLVDLERSNRVVPVQKRRDAYQVKIDAYSKFNSYVRDISIKAKALSAASDFNLFTQSSSNEDVARIKGSSGAVAGSYQLQVFQTAQSEKLISSDGKIIDQHAPLSTQGVRVGEGLIRINGVDIQIGAEDSLQELRKKINAATDADGNSIGVSASVLKIADANYRLVLTATESGAQGASYTDVSGSTLVDLGLIATAAGDKGTTTQKLQSTLDIAAAFSSLALNKVVSYSGLDHNGNAISGSFVKDGSSTVEDLVAQMNRDFHGMADVALEAGGQLSITDKSAGISQLRIDTLSFGASATETGVVVPMDLTVAGRNGAGVVSVGREAVFSVDNIAMSSSTNTAEGFIEGVSLELRGVSIQQPVTLELARDDAGIEKKVNELLNSYNALIRFSKESTRRATEDDEDAKSGALVGDTTVSTLVGQFRNIFMTDFSDFNATYTTMTMAGVKTNVQSGELELDGEMFRKALGGNFDEVVRLFTREGYASTTNVTMGRTTSDTTSGIYDLEEVDAQYMRIRLQGSSLWSQSDARNGDIVTFSEGAAKGLSLTAPFGALGGASATFTHSKGLGVLLDELAEKFTDPTDGVITMRQDSMRKGIEDADERIERVEARVESYRLRLVSQFSDMERTMNNLKTQSSNMLNALGT